MAATTTGLSMSLIHDEWQAETSLSNIRVYPYKNTCAAFQKRESEGDRARERANEGERGIQGKFHLYLLPLNFNDGINRERERETKDQAYTYIMY